MTTTTRKAWPATAVAAAVAALAIAVPIAEPFPNKVEGAGAAYSADQIIVRARPGVSAARLRGGLAARGLSLGVRIPHTRLFAVRTNARTPAAAIGSLADAALVAEATPDYVRRASYVPNDPYYASAQPYLATIRMPQAWDVSDGSSGVVIAVVDSGVTPVADLAGQLLPGHNFVSDDDATFDEEPVPDSADARDTYGHGTFVAGIAAATTNNAVGIAGVAWEARVLPVKVLNAHGVGDDFQIEAGIVWAVDHGASIVNLSLGGPGESAGLCEAVTYATSRGALVVAAAGNQGTGVAAYPAACPGVLAVSATDTNGDFASFSNYGPWISVAAPGVQITSMRHDELYGTYNGTSFAAPIVSGVAALLEAQHPDWSASQIATRLERTAQDRGPAGHDSYYGYGLLDAYAALGGPTQAPVTPSRDSLEPNDVAVEATALSTSASATIAPEGDIDWYAVRVRAPGALVFRVDGPPSDPRVGPSFNPVLKIYDHDLKLIATQDTSGFGEGERAVVRVRSAGRYYLRVANDAGTRSPGSYSVAVTMRRSH